MRGTFTSSIVVVVVFFGEVKIAEHRWISG